MGTANAERMKGSLKDINLADARKFLRKHIKTPEGAICPCCEKLDKIYDRPIHVSAIKTFVTIAKLQGDSNEWQHTTKFNKRNGGGDFAKLRFMGLLETKEVTEGDDKKHSGYYRVTPEGFEFVEGKRAIPKRILLYRNTPLGVSGDTQFIYDFWPGFSYSELFSSGIEK